MTVSSHEGVILGKAAAVVIMQMSSHRTVTTPGSGRRCRACRWTHFHWRDLMRNDPDVTACLCHCDASQVLNTCSIIFTAAASTPFIGEQNDQTVYSKMCSLEQKHCFQAASLSLAVVSGALSLDIGCFLFIFSVVLYLTVFRGMFFFIS